MSEIQQKLTAPFPPEDIEWRIGRSGTKKDGSIWATALAYVTNRAIMNRLDEVFGVLGWKNEFKEWHGDSQLCGISVWDDDKKHWITKWDGADNTNFEGTKGGLSDSQKRAAVQFGIGRYLYNLTENFVEVSKDKKSGWKYQSANKKGDMPAFYWQIPDLPKFALPDRTEDIKKTLLECKTVDDCTILWDSLTKDEQAKMRNAFSAKKAELMG